MVSLFTLNINKQKKCRFCNRILSSLQISRHQKFCSRKCKNESQKFKILLTCKFCGKEFSIYPYLKRKNNYCSRKCYWDATRKKKERICIVCGEKFKPLDCLVRKGFGKYCSKKCQFSVYDSKRMKLACPKCKKEFWVSPSTASRRKFCTKKCKDDYERDYVKKLCRNCHKYFLLPRWELEKGKGSFCCRKCFQEYKGETSIESAVRKVLKRKKVKFVQELKIGKYYVDFFLPEYSIAVECDGEYWHGSILAQKRDLEKDKFLLKKGYKVCRFTEKDIKESKGDCVKKLFEK